MTAAKVVIVLGMGPGLGSAVAHRFARGGFAVELVARSEDYLNQLKTDKCYRISKRHSPVCRFSRW